MTVNVKLAPFSQTANLDPSTLAAVSVTPNQRASRPYPPGNLRINSAGYGTPAPATVSGDLAFSWASRNRLTQSGVVRQDAADVAGETGQTFKVVILLAGVVKHTLAGLTAESYVYSAAARGADDPDFTKPVTIQIFSTVGGLDSFFCQSFTTVMAGGPGILPVGARYEFGSTAVGDLTF